MATAYLGKCFRGHVSDTTKFNSHTDCDHSLTAACVVQTVRRNLLRLVLRDVVVGRVRRRAPVPPLPRAAVTRPRPRPRARPRRPRRPRPSLARPLVPHLLV